MSQVTLTKREHEVLGYILKGMNDKQIAEAMGVKLFTVRFHIRNIYEKHEVGSRSKLIVKCWEFR